MNRSSTSGRQARSPEPHPLRAVPSLREHAVVYAVLLTALALSHAWLLRLPYFWDEAGYFIPAARDLLLSGDLIPHSTLSNAHPPLLMLCLAACWKVLGYSPLITRSLMLAIAALTLLGLWRLGTAISNRKVATAALVCTALYPVFFAQSTLAHLDMLVAALTVWGLAFYLEGRRWWMLLALALAPVAKETAVITPLTLLAWELMAWLPGKIRFTPARRSIARSLSLLLCCVPLAAWFAYHHHRTGFVLGNPEYLRYNLQATVTPLRILIALGMRLWHTLGYMNLFALTLLAAAALRARPVEDKEGPRRPIPAPALNVILLIIAAHVVALAVLGGAVLARYMLPVIPLVIVVAVHTVYSRIPQWRTAVAVAAVALLAGVFFNPPYRFAPEDNLTYADYVVLHQRAAAYLHEHTHGERVLTAWPASDELTKPYLGYVQSAIPVIRIENFSQPQMELAMAASGQYTWAYLFSTKYEPGGPVTRWRWWNGLLQRFFDYHQDVTPETAARQLDGKIVFSLRRRGEWVALVQMQRTENARQKNSEPFKHTAARDMQAARPSARSW